jgi:hypothetical protein
VRCRCCSYGGGQDHERDCERARRGNDAGGGGSGGAVSDDSDFDGGITF